MSTALKLTPISVEEYLAAELVSKTKHEYLGGYVYAMAGVRNTPSIIQMKLGTSLLNRLRGMPAIRFGHKDPDLIAYPGAVRLPRRLRYQSPESTG